MADINSIQNGDWSNAGTWDAPPGAGDTVYVNHDVKYDVDSTTEYAQLRIINGGGKLYFDNTKDTRLEVAGAIYIYNGTPPGILEIGGPTLGAIPKEYTATLVINGVNSLSINGHLIMQGASDRITKAATKLAADASLGATSLTVEDTVGWQDGDIIGIAPTDRVYTHIEQATVSGATVSGIVNLMAPLSYAHTGTGDAPAEVINLTRNVKLISDDLANPAYAKSGANQTVDIDADWAEFYGLGSSSSYKGFELTANEGQWQRFNQCSFWHPTSSTKGYYLLVLKATFVVENCVFFNSYSDPVVVSLPDSDNAVLNHIVMIGSRYGYSQMDGDLLTMDDITIAGAKTGGIAMDTCSAQKGSFLVHDCHSLTSHKAYDLRAFEAPVTKLEAYRCAGNGIDILNSSYGAIITTIIAKGCAKTNVLFTEIVECEIDSLEADGLPGYASEQGIFSTYGSVVRIKEANLGLVTGHTVADISLGTANGAFLYIPILNAGSAVVHTPSYGGKGGGFIAVERFGDVAGAQRRYYAAGLISRDTTVKHSGDASAKMEPSYADIYLPLEFEIPCDASEQVTVTVYLKKSATTWAANPILTLEGAGLAKQTVEMTEDNTDWNNKSISGTPTDKGALRFRVLCKDTAKYLNVDDIEVTYG
jgi:hypothetical protein